MQSENAQFPMLVTLLADRDVGQPPAIVERIVPMLMTLLGSVTLVSPVS